MSLPQAPAPLVSIVIPAFNKWEFTQRCLQSVREHTPAGCYEIIVVDDASTDATASQLVSSEDVLVVRNEHNQGFARSVNAGARLARGKYLLLLNNDTEAMAGWLQPMLAVLDRVAHVAAVGCKLLFPDGSIQHGGVAFAYAGPDPITVFHVDHGQRQATFAEARIVSAVTAACMLLRPQAFWQVGGLDEGYLNGHEDVDLCLRLREAGHGIVYVPSAQLIHHESVSEGRFDAAWVNLDRFGARWIGRFKAFDIDFRSSVPAAPVDARRAGVSIIVPVADAYGTVAACLENVLYNTGPQDEVVIVNDHASGATQAFLRAFANEHPHVRLLASEERGFMAAAAQGLRLAEKQLGAVLAPNLKVAPGWLERLVAHANACSSEMVVCPGRGDPLSLPEIDLIHPPRDPNPLRFHGAAGVPGDLGRALPLSVPLLFGHRPALQRLFSERSTMLGLRAARATDVRAFPLDAPLQATLCGDAFLEACSRDDVVERSQLLPRHRDLAAASCSDDEFVCLVNAAVVLPSHTPVITMLLAALISSPSLAAVGPTLPIGRGPQRNGRGLYTDIPGLEAFAENHALRHAGTVIAVPRLETAVLLLRRPTFDAWAQTQQTSESLAGVAERLQLKLGVVFGTYAHHAARRALPMQL